MFVHFLLPVFRELSDEANPALGDMLPWLHQRLLYPRNLLRQSVMTMHSRLAVKQILSCLFRDVMRKRLSDSQGTGIGHSHPGRILTLQSPDDAKRSRREEEMVRTAHTLLFGCLNPSALCNLLRSARVKNNPGQSGLLMLKGLDIRKFLYPKTRRVT